MDDHQQTLLTSFLEITAVESPQTATQFLEITNWDLEEAIQLFYTSGGGEVAAPAPARGFGVREAAEPVREHFLNGSVQGEDNLASLYRPPHGLMFRGSFERAKDHASRENKWLLLNIQSTTEFSSHMLNRDTWANEGVSETIKANFVFWQAHDDTEEGAKVSSYYRLESMPAVLVIDPITGQKMRAWSGMVQPETLLEHLLPYMDGSPSDHHASLFRNRHGKSPKVTTTTPQEHLSIPHKQDEDLHRGVVASMEKVGISESSVNQTVKRPADYPALPAEPNGDRSLLCRVAVRLPNGRRVQRNFLRNESVQLLWSFCSSELKEEGERPFRLAQAVPGVTKYLDYDRQSTFQESGLANSMISLTWV